jgi:hypothetical protein
VWYSNEKKNFENLFPSSGEGVGDTYSVGSVKDVKGPLKRSSNGSNRVDVSHHLARGRPHIKTPWPLVRSELYQLSDRHLSTKFSAKFCG